MVTLGANNMSMWYPNSRATSHVTSTDKNIKLPRAYNGNEFILAADGNSMAISYSGRTNFFANSSSFVLNDVLLVSSASKNLLLVYRFCANNNLYIEFDAQRVKARDLQSREVVLWESRGWVVLVAD